MGVEGGGIGTGSMTRQSSRCPPVRSPEGPSPRRVPAAAQLRGRLRIHLCGGCHVQVRFATRIPSHASARSYTTEPLTNYSPAWTSDTSSIEPSPSPPAWGAGFLSRACDGLVLLLTPGEFRLEVRGQGWNWWWCATAIRVSSRCRKVAMVGRSGVRAARANFATLQLTWFRVCGGSRRC